MKDQARHEMKVNSFGITLQSDVNYFETMALQVICKKPQAKTKSHVRRRSHDSANYPHDTGKKEPNTAASTESKDTKDVEGDI